MKCTKTVGDLSITYEASSVSEVISLMKAVEDYDNDSKIVITSKINKYNDLPNLVLEHK